MVADGVDQNCDTNELCYEDFDDDNFVDNGNDTVVSTDLDCTDSGEHTAITTADCNDNDNSIFPGATEVVNDGIDQDCVAGDVCYEDFDDDNFVDNGNDEVVSADLDCNDSGEHTTTTTADCNDNDNTICPGCTEIVNDGIDQDCTAGDVCYDDTDGDDFVENGNDTVVSSDLDCNDSGEHTAVTTADCNDNDVTICPGCTEVVNDGIDQDCVAGDVCYEDFDDDNFVDNGNDTVVSADLDCDDSGEHTTTTTADCNDNDATICPTCTEVIADGIDQNCDTNELCYEDFDDDNFVDNGTDTVVSTDLDCTDSGEHTAATTADCNDNDSTICPGCTEVVNDGIDQDCSAGDVCYEDNDGDDFVPGGNDTVVSADLDCLDAGEHTAPTVGDCNDSNAFITPSVSLENPSNSLAVTACTDGADAGTECMGGGDDLNADGDCSDPGEDADAVASDPDCDENAAVTGNEAFVDNVDNDGDGQVDELCTNPNAVVFTEYYSDSANAEPDWCEVTNTTWFDVDLRSMQLGDGTNTENLPNSTLLLANGGRALLCMGSAPTGETCDATLSTIVLADPGGTTSLTITNEGGTIDTLAASILGAVTATTSKQLDADELDDEFSPGSNEPDNDTAGEWCNATATSDTWSGGTASPKDPNENCP